jgi:hypothetical protein
MRKLKMFKENIREAALHSREPFLLLGLGLAVNFVVCCGSEMIFRDPTSTLVSVPDLDWIRHAFISHISCPTLPLFVDSEDYPLQKI